MKCLSSTARSVARASIGAGGVAAMGAPQKQRRLGEALLLWTVPAKLGKGTRAAPSTGRAAARLAAPHPCRVAQLGRAAALVGVGAACAGGAAMDGRPLGPLASKPSGGGTVAGETSPLLQYAPTHGGSYDGSSQGWPGAPGGVGQPVPPELHRCRRAYGPRPLVVASIAIGAGSFAQGCARSAAAWAQAQR